MGAYLKLTQERHLFQPDMQGAEPIRHPRTYGHLGRFAVAEQMLTTADKTQIQVWEREALPGKPHYIVFHGNNGHWGDTGPYPPEKELIPLNRKIRMDLLHDIAETGAGFTAVSLRGYGKSGGKPSEAGFAQDIEAVIDHVTRFKNIPHNRILVAGESMGATVAAMTAEMMTKQGKPPAMLGLMNPFESMARQAQEHTAKKFSVNFSAEQLDKILRHPLNTKQHLRALAPVTRVFIGTSGADRTIDPANSVHLREAAHRRGFQVKHEVFEGCEHCTWPTEKFVEGIEKFFHTLKSVGTLAR